MNRLFTIAIAVCAASSAAAQTAIAGSEPADTSANPLGEVQVVARRRPPAFSQGKEGGQYSLGAAAISALPRLLGNSDPLRIMQALPMVASSDFISGGIYVQGSENAHNHVSIDGMDIYNPVHFLGLFSVFNTPHFDTFDITMNTDNSASADFVGADISANTSSTPVTDLQGSASVGLLDAYATVKTPVNKGKSSLTLSGRLTYLNALYGDAIKLGNAPLDYGFQDFNATYLQSLGKGYRLKFSAFYGSDNMKVSDPNYSADILMGWRNMAAGATLLCPDKSTHTLGYSFFSNKARVSYADIDRNMPSRLYALNYSGVMKIGRATIGAGAVYRHITPQYVEDLRRGGSEAPRSSGGSAEIRVGGMLPFSIGRFELQPGAKLVYYNGGDLSRIYALPAFTAVYRMSADASLKFHAGRRAQFVHKIEESTLGLPTDFWIAAGRNYRPLESMDYSLSYRGRTGLFNLGYDISAYYRTFSHMMTWNGSLFDMLGNRFDPMSGVESGRGRAYGIAAMVQGRVGPVQGILSYTLSKSSQKFSGKSSRWYPYLHDRTHDLKLNVVWNISRGLTASASFVYASGQPFTEPLYAYMIGENLICEFKEYNSSRVSAMHRLDLALDWMFYRHGPVEQGLNVSVFNAYAHGNELFRSYSFSVKEGIHPSSMTMGYAIPSLSYYIKF